ncbi:MAG: ABC transporter ATP-binding protein, partial [Actinomycetota bacterium]
MSEKTLPVADTTATFRHLRTMLRRRRSAVALVVALAVGVTIASAAVPLIVGAAVDLAVDGDGDRNGLAWLAGLLAIAAVVGALGTMTGRYQAAKLGESVLAELRSGVYDAVVALPASTVERVGTGELVARTTGDVEVLANATRSTVPMLFIGSILSVGLTIGLFVTDVRLAVAGIVAFGAVAWPGVRWYLRHAPPRYAHQRQVEGERSGAILEAYNGRHTLWSFGATGEAIRRIDRHGQTTVDAALATTAARNRLRPALRIGQGASLAAILAVGAWLLGDGRLTAGTLTAAAFFMLRLIDPISMLVEQLDTVQQAQAALARIIGVIEHTDAAPPSTGAPLATGSGAISIDGVGFGYRPDVPVLHDISLDIPAGSHVLLVGPSGAGKSTLARLLCAMDQPGTGSIRIGEHDLADVEPVDRPRLVALVAQETHVFARSIRENVALAHTDATTEEVRAALRTVGAADWADGLPAGIDTIVDADHPAITPARAQQLNLARILCLDPAVLILDEATADLDPITAATTERRVEVALRGRTVVTIAHRLDGAPDADLIVMIDEGRIVDVGTHRGLVATAGPYADLWASWSR